VVSLIGLLLLGVGWIGGYLTPHHAPKSSIYVADIGSWGGGNIPIHICSSSYGVQTSTTTPDTVATARTTLPRSVASQLSFYTDATRGIQPVLAPNGWNCTATIGADGGSSLIVSPPHVRVPSGSNATEETMAVTFNMDPACRGCVADLACPIFLNAEQLLGYSPDNCTNYEPPTESVKFLQGGPTQNSGVAEISDPAGAPGLNQFSGGDYPALGSLAFDGSSGEPSAASISCVLPPSHRELCSAVVSDFESNEANATF